MLDALTTAEVQALRLQLHDFASRQSDQVVKICCSAVDLDLARIGGRQDEQTLRELAASVEQLAKAVQTARTAGQGATSPRMGAIRYPLNDREFDGSASIFRTCPAHLANRRLAHGTLVDGFIAMVRAANGLSRHRLRLPPL
jgi:hypothetical protein